LKWSLASSFSALRVVSPSLAVLAGDDAEAVMLSLVQPQSRPMAACPW
jgi:hypothetical protein